jgi:hypothetical protein
MYINKSTIYFSNRKQFCRKTIVLPVVLPVLPRSLGKIEKSFSPKLTDYFIQGVRKMTVESVLYLFLSGAVVGVIVW